MENTKGFLVIDMQKSSFTPKTSRFDTKGVVLRINKLDEVFRDLSYPVIYIQNDRTGTGEFEKNIPGWENLDDLNVALSAIRIDNTIRVNQGL
jgi:nicotinamidase-related amidase